MCTVEASVCARIKERSKNMPRSKNRVASANAVRISSKPSRATMAVASRTFALRSNPSPMPVNTLTLTAVTRRGLPLCGSPVSMPPHVNRHQLQPVHPPSPKANIKINRKVLADPPCPIRPLCGDRQKSESRSLIYGYSKTLRCKPGRFCFRYIVTLSLSAHGPPFVPQ